MQIILGGFKVSNEVCSDLGKDWDGSGVVEKTLSGKESSQLFQSHIQKRRINMIKLP